MKNVYQIDATELNELMMHYVHSLLILFSKCIVCRADMSVNDFRNANEKPIRHALEWVNKKFSYQLSYEQMNKSIQLYIKTKHNPLQDIWALE